MTTERVPADDGRSAAARALTRALRELEAQLEAGASDESLHEATVQEALAVVVKLYAGILEQGRPFPPFPARDGTVEVTATEVAVTASEMLKARQIELFELGMWQTWGGLHAKGS